MDVIEYNTTEPLFLSVKTKILSQVEPDGNHFQIYPNFPKGSFGKFKIGDLILYPGSPISEVRQIIAFYPAADLVVTVPPIQRKYMPGRFGSMRISDLLEFDIYFRPA